MKGGVTLVSSGRHAIALFLLILCVAICSHAQTTSAKEPTASVSGKVTFKGKGLPGIMVIASDPYRGYAKPSHRGVTDASGNYRISNIPEGTYRISPHALAFAVENRELTNPVNVADGETIEDMNFILVRGGVITGKVTDADGQALIEQPVILQSFSDQDPMGGSHHQVYTDDRGIYRAFGLRRGKYKVAAGHPGEQRLPVPGRGAQAYKTTFYPSTTDEAKATVIEVSEGSEIKDVDIATVGSDPGGFKVSGRIVHGETGKPLPNIVYGIAKHYDGGDSSTSGARSNADGEFKFEKVLPGKYSVYVETEHNSEILANPVPFEVTDHDIKGLVLKTVKGASISGVVVLESSDEKAASKKLSELHVYALIENGDEYSQGNTAVRLQPDGSFRLNGLRAGNAQIEVSSMRAYGSSDLSVVRIERDGIVQTGKINIKEGEQVQGIRLIVNLLTGAIRGQVKIEGGELPSSARMFISITLLDGDPNRSSRNEELDARRRFLAQGLAAGRYEVKANVFIPGRMLVSDETKQIVNVAENSVSEVVLTVKLKTNQDEDDDP